MYARQKNAEQPQNETVDAALQQDRVELSANAPRPLDARMIEEAVQVAQRMMAGQALSPSQTERLREDRVFASLTAMFSAGGNKGRLLDAWLDGAAQPPTGFELDSAYRRLSQRVADMGGTADPRAVEEARLTALEAFRGVDLQALVRALSESVMGMAGAAQD